MAKKQQSVYEIKVKGIDDIKSLNTEISKLNGNYDKLSKEGKKASDSTKNVGIGAKDSSSGISKMAKGAVAATAALVAFSKISKIVSQQIKQGIEVFKGYEFEMAKVRAITGANEKEFRKLDKTAQQLGRSTFFTAQQVAALQLNFSKLGFTSAEVLKVQEAALTAATATGEDLARTATVIGSTVRGFGLDASEGARVADVMAASFTSSALTLEKFQTSMTKVSPVAKLLGMDLEETTAVMGVLTDAGIEASIAGTSLRNIFLKLGDPSSDLAKSIGFTVNSGEDMVREFRRMRDEGINVEKMLKVVDVRQVAAISTMIEHIDKIEQQTEAFRNSTGAAQSMADIIQASLQGSILRFQSALDGLRIVLFEKVAPALTSTINALAKFFNIIAKGAETPMSEMLEQDRLKLREYEIELKSSNTSQEDRVKIIKELKRLYPDYLKDLNAEKATNVELTTALKNVNDQLANKILLQRENEKIAEQAEDEADRLAKVIEKEDVLKDLMADLVDTQGFVIKENVSLIEQGEDIITQLEKSYKERNIGGRPQELRDIENAVYFLEGAEKKLNEEVEKGIKLTEQRNQLMERLGIEPEEVVSPRPTVTGIEGTSTGDGDAKKEAKNISEVMLATQEILAEETFNLQQKFLDGEITTREQYNDLLLEKQAEFLSEGLALEVLTTEEKMKLTDMLHNVKMQQLKDEQDAEIDRIQQMKETGKLLMKIGEAEGGNNKIKQVGIKITQAAAIAEGIRGLINAQTGIAAQSKLLFPENIIAMAATAAQVASVIVNLKAFLGGGGGAGSNTNTEVYGEQGTAFANGGLTRGGMFEGNSHANGGVKFRVGGRIHEAEGGEAIINKRSTSMFRPVLSAINSYNGNGVKFADGGLLNSGEKFAMGGELRSAQQLISGGTGVSKVVIVESDMTEVQNRISAIESQATF